MKKETKRKVRLALRKAIKISITPICFLIWFSFVNLLMEYLGHKNSTVYALASTLSVIVIHYTLRWIYSDDHE